MREYSKFVGMDVHKSTVAVAIVEAGRKKIRPDVKVVLSSGYNESEADSRFSCKGLAGFIHKPYRPTALVAKFHETPGT